MTAISLEPRPVAASLDELLAGATDRVAMKTSDSKSGSTFERVIVDGQPCVVKHLHCDDDWIQRATGDLRCRPLLMWQSGLLDALPPSIDHATLGCAAGLGRNGWGAALLLRDVGERLVPEGDDPVSLEQHERFLDHLGDLHAAFWGWEDTVGLMPMTHRYLELSPLTAASEAARRGTDAVPTIIGEGWPRFGENAPAAARVVTPLLEDPWPLVSALARTPASLIHGDTKFGNLGAHGDGRTILLDWAVPGVAAPCVELAWYLAINSARLPHSKEDAIACYRDALHRHGVDTSAWWETQLDLALLGGLVQFGWEKHDDELAWWADRALRAARHL
jgi:hypothetical protein